MNHYVIVVVLSSWVLMILNVDSFKSEQLKYKRVRDAYKEKELVVASLLSDTGLKKNDPEIFIRIFKKEEELEVWARNSHQLRFKILVTYNFCATSGKLGPKRKSGDLQIPEGFYRIDRFNPASNFHLSLGINYPNQADKLLGYQSNLGGDIFLHGGCATIGCVPITDNKIKELYVLAIEATDSGQKNIRVHIYPSKLGDAGLALLKVNEPQALYPFWKQLNPIYEYFEKHRSLPDIKVSKDGKYSIP